MLIQNFGRLKRPSIMEMDYESIINTHATTVTGQPPYMNLIYPVGI